MSTWKDIVIAPNATIREAMLRLNKTGLGAIIVCDPSYKLLGCLSDGDIRKSLVKLENLDEPVKNHMSKSPTVIRESQSKQEIITLFQRFGFNFMPVVNTKQHVIGIRFVHEFVGASALSVPIFLMAGGLGSRLGKLTRNTPKPMLLVNNKPIIEHIIDTAISQGFSNFFISINYLGEQIRDYFKDGSDKGITIEYLEESFPLGTGGSLSLLPSTSGPLLVCNADVYGDIPFNAIIQHHLSNNASATMATRRHKIENSFGVVFTDGVDITGFEEKPVWKTNVNAGIYVLDGSALKHLKKNKPINMPEIFSLIRERQLRTIVYQLEQECIDLGTIENFNAVAKRNHA